MAASVLARVLVLVVGAVMIAVGAASAGGVISLVPTYQAPTLSATLSYNGTGETVGLQMHIVALPKGEMVVNKIVATFGTASETYYPYNATTGYIVTGYFTVTRYFTFSAAGTYSLDATLYATGSGHDNGTQYKATAAPISVTTPLAGTAGGCTVGCPSLSSAFTASASGLTVTLADASVVANATVSMATWEFGDGISGNGLTTTHTYAAPGTYPITETVTALGTNGATVNASSTANVTVSGASSNGCQGSASCPSRAPSLSGLLVPLLFGAGVGLLVVALLWRWEALIALGAGVAVGLAYGAFALGFL